MALRFGYAHGSFEHGGTSLACWSIGIPLSNKAVVSKNNLDWCCTYCRQLCMKYMGLT